MLEFVLFDMAGFDGGMFWHGGGIATLKEWNFEGMELWDGVLLCIVGVTLPNNNTR
jgi:hypothetical protein